MEDDSSRSRTDSLHSNGAMSIPYSDDDISHSPGMHPSISNWDSLTTPSSVQSSSLLTVDNKWKVEGELSQRMSQKEKPSKLVPVAKWIITFLLGSAITILFVVTKVSFISLSRVLNTTSTATEPGSHDVKTTGQFLLVFMILEVPYVLLFMRAIWQAFFTIESCWPRRSAVLCCFLVGILEPLGIVILALKLLPMLTFSEGVLLMSNSITLSIFVETWRTLMIPGRPWIKVSMIASCLFILIGLGLTVYIIYFQDENSDSSNFAVDLVHGLACVLCINIAWLPRLLRHINQPSIETDETVNANQSARNLTSMPEIRTDHNMPDANTTEQTQRGQSNSNVDNEATWKATFILYGVKIVSTFFFCFIFFYVDSNFLSENFSKKSQETFISAWDFTSEEIHESAWAAFGVNLSGALVCYVLVFVASHANMQRGCLLIPFMVSFPLTILFASDNSLCYNTIGSTKVCQSEHAHWYLIFLTTLSMMIGQTLALGRHLFRKEKIFLRSEEKYFWIPGYNGAIPDAWLLLDTRTTIKEGRLPDTDRIKSRKTRVYICTTMYREDESEMQQLLESLKKVNVAQAQGETLFEAHIIFDGGVRQKNLSEFALILISLLKDALDIEPAACTKSITPYGMKLSWGLPSIEGKPQMTFSIHLKDNTLVKNKKRWSQVMYMSYVLDFLKNTANPNEETYILTTDADVMFTPDSVEALLDLMCRDPTVGAVCARTHPMGSGPLVWYQIFEYAIGHWFQKASEHVLGSVLCAPGCFSVYRCRALEDILPKYCKKVESSFDFLTKDMGEDRWLCTLMVQSGWRIEYCAASENSTNCPSEFEEFYKQRRRWIASTLANLMLIIKEWNYISLFNHRVSVIFLVYQVLLLFATLISPSTVILVVAGGLDFAWGIDAIASVVIQLICCFLYAMVCVLTESKTQLFIAKIYTFLYAVIMCAVIVGTIEQVVDDLSNSSHNKTTTLLDVMAPKTNHISLEIPISVTTIYFGFLICIFLLAGLLHPKEMTCLFYGFCYLLCIPSAYLILMIYSICNLTDSSWGTREGETSGTSSGKKSSWAKRYKEIFFSIFFCLAPKPKPTHGVDAETQTFDSSLSRNHSLTAQTQRSFLESGDRHSTGLGFEDSYASNEFLNADFQQMYVEEDVPISVEEWLPLDLKGKYAEILKKHGYENTLFIKGITEPDLVRMGITIRGHIQFLMSEISKLSAFEIQYKVPTNVNEWLKEIGLIQYKSNFRRNRICTPRNMEILKTFGKKDIVEQLGIGKEGHIKRLLVAIRMLRDPSESQQKAIVMRQIIDDSPTVLLQMSNVEENDFWERLKAKCLEPDLKAFGIDSEIKVKLVELRNNWLMVVAVTNILWLILISTLASKGNLTLLGANPIGLLFLFIFGIIFVVQFCAMLVHRLSTLSHYIARAPYTFGKPFYTSWSFRDKVSHGILNDLRNKNANRMKPKNTIRNFLRSRTNHSINSIEHNQQISNENSPLLSNS